MHVPEQPPFLGLAERRARARARACGRRRGAAPPRAAGRPAGAGAAARSRGRAWRPRRCARGARPRTRGARRRRGRAASRSPARSPRRARTRGTSACEAGVRDLAGEELEEPVELVGVAAERRGRRRRIGLGGLDERTCTCSRPPKRSTRPSTRTASPSSKRAVEQVDVAPDPRLDRPLVSTSSSARYGAPFLVVSRRFRATAYTPSTVRSSSSSEIVVTRSSLGPAQARYARQRWPTSSRSAPSATTRPTAATRHRTPVRRGRRRASATSSARPIPTTSST